MLRHLLRVLVIYAIVVSVLIVATFADNPPANRTIQEEVWAIPVILPTIAYVVRPVGDGPFPLVVMNHGVSLNQRERSFFRSLNSGMQRCGWQGPIGKSGQH